VGHTGIPGPHGGSDRGGARAGRLDFMDQVGLTDSSHEEKMISFSHCIFHTTQKWKIIMGKILKELKKIWKIAKR
jgi:hypothetical protein